MSEYHFILYLHTHNDYEHMKILPYIGLWEKNLTEIRNFELLATQIAFKGSFTSVLSFMTLEKNLVSHYLLQWSRSRTLELCQECEKCE